MNFSTGKLVKSFGYAFKGFAFVVKTQQNFRFHLLVTLAVIVSGFIAKLSPAEWCLVILTIAMVLAIEILNTAVEKLVDFISPGFHEQAGMVKDISAAAVLLTAIGAVTIGCIIFLPKIF
ncbi:MAG: diacylglycerol kinase family protein [bacterium]